MISSTLGIFPQCCGGSHRSELDLHSNDMRVLDHFHGTANVTLHKCFLFTALYKGIALRPGQLHRLKQALVVSRQAGIDLLCAVIVQAAAAAAATARFSGLPPDFGQLVGQPGGSLSASVPMAARQQPII